MIQLRRHLEVYFPFYLGNSNLSLTFCFEEIVTCNKEKTLKKGRSMNKEKRWYQGKDRSIKKIRVVLPPPYYKSQIYVARDGEAIHGQHTMKEIIDYAIEYEDFPPHIFIWNNHNYEDDFISVVNGIMEDSVLPKPERIKSCALESVIKNEDGTLRKKKSGVYVMKKTQNKRANIAMDIGVSTEQANKRGISNNVDGTTNHHSKPPMLENTITYQDLLHSASDIMRSTSLRKKWYQTIHSL